LTSCTGISNFENLGTSGSVSVPQKYSTGLTDEQKITFAIARKKELRTIRKGDYMTLKNNPNQAISYYLSVLEKLPKDTVIKRKIAHTYYLLRDWKNAYSYYSAVPIFDLKENDRNELFRSLFFDESRLDRIWELSRYDLDVMNRDYYKIVDTCYSGIHNCIVSIESYTGSSPQILALQKTISKSTQISPDFQYRNFLVAAEFYQYSMYRVTDILTTEILSKRPNYTEVRKLKWFALYELGKYTQARDILLKYIEENLKDLESIVKLGEIYASIWDFSTSSLYLNNAVTAWYQHKTEIERRLAYNYGALGDTASMLKVLSYLIQETDATEDDFAVAISLALSQWENTRAYAWAYTAMDKYKNSVLLMPLYFSASRINGKFNDIITYIEALSDEIASSPLIQLEYAIALHELGNNDKALLLFTTISELDPESDWSIEAIEYIKIIQAMQTHSWSTRSKK
jgi:tetratricopeptide (TPR) repeat protein